MVKNLKKEFNIKTEKGTYKTLIWKDKNSGDYLVKAVNLPEVVTFGKSFAEAKKMAKDALELYCDCLKLTIARVIARSEATKQSL